MAPKQAKQLVYEQIRDPQKVLAEIEGTQFVAVTADTLYLAGLSGSWGQVKVKRYPLDAISTINIKEGTGLLSRITIEIITSGYHPTRPDAFSILFGGGGSPNLDNLVGFAKGRRQEVHDFVNLVLDLRSKQKEGSPQQAAASIPEQIQQLAQLRDQGILSEEEFTTKKQELLSRM